MTREYKRWHIVHNPDLKNMLFINILQSERLSKQIGYQIKGMEIQEDVVDHMNYLKSFHSLGKVLLWFWKKKVLQNGKTDLYHIMRANLWLLD